MGRQLTGLADVLENFKKLRTSAQKKHTRKAARQAMNIAKDAARNNAKGIDDPATKEKIFKNIVVKEKNKGKKNPTDIVMAVGIKGGSYANNKQNRRSGRAGQDNENVGNASNPGGDTFYWRYLEFGTATNPAVPFMRPALADNTDQVIDRFADVFSEEVKKELN